MMPTRDLFERRVPMATQVRLRTKRGGFTIVDMLVSLAIMMLMIATVLPALKHAKELSLRTVCTAHERGQGQFLERYNQDYNGSFPYFQYAVSVDRSSLVVGTQSRSLIDSGLGYFQQQVMICPVDQYMGNVRYLESGALRTIPVSFAFNIDLLVQQQRVHYLQNPSQIVSLYDGSMSGHADEGFNIEGYYAGSYDVIEYARLNRHLNQVNVLYLDGHVESNLRFLPDQVANGGSTFVAATWAAAHGGSTSPTASSGGSDDEDHDNGSGSDTEESDNDNDSDNDNGNGNNGHGNNDDGTDVSNPGQGNDGPNGGVDESGDVDDESKGDNHDNNSDDEVDDDSDNESHDNDSSGDTQESDIDNDENNNGQGNNDDEADDHDDPADASGDVDNESSDEQGIDDGSEESHDENHDSASSDDSEESDSDNDNDNDNGNDNGGHGNNDDGTDVSNLGQGNGGPNGGVD
ncbi:MAG: hypothetical protein JKX85_06730, partial [Phycisphaeraceae bacterium]|nr:hypothetical protein [Phycisphaeraceae bacterium]